MKRNLKHAMLGLSLLGLAPAALGQVARVDPNTPRDGTAAGTWLLLPVTAQTAAAAGSGTASMTTMSALDAAAQNPSGLTLNTGTSALFSRMQFVSDVGTSYFGVAQRFGNNNVSLSVTAFGSGDEFVRTEDNPDVYDGSATWSANYIAAGLGYARQFTDRISAGITVKYISETMAENLNAQTAAFDAGMTYAVPQQGLRFGVAVRNVGGALKYDGDGLSGLTTNTSGNQTVTLTEAASSELPASLDFGVTYTRPFSPDMNMAVAASFRSVQYAKDQVGGSLTLGFRDMLYVRGGYQWEDDRDNSYFTGANMGAGVKLGLGGARVGLDYTYTFTRYFNRMQFITASVTF